MESKILVGTSALSLYILLLHLQLAAGGSTYVRWGRTTCNTGSTVLYKGFVVGSVWNDAGSGANYLCLPLDLQIGNTVAGRQNYSGSLYGVQYNFLEGYAVNDKPFSFANVGGQNLNFMDALCAVCYSATSSTNVMIPGRQDCGKNNADWKVEYKGYLMSTTFNQKRSEYICVDEAPEAQASSTENKLGGALAPVQLGCGILPCSDIDANEVTCAVCSI